MKLRYTFNEIQLKLVYKNKLIKKTYTGRIALLGLYLNIRDKAQIFGRIFVARNAHRRDFHRLFLLF